MSLLVLAAATIFSLPAASQALGGPSPVMLSLTRESAKDPAAAAALEQSRTQASESFTGESSAPLPAQPPALRGETEQASGRPAHLKPLSPAAPVAAAGPMPPPEPYKDPRPLGAYTRHAAVYGGAALLIGAMFMASPLLVFAGVALIGYAAYTKVSEGHAPSGDE